MGYTIIQEDEPIPFTKSLVAVIFGEPGVGKSSLIFTANSPILLDYDDGVRRAANRGKVVQFSDWASTLEFLDSGEIEKHGIKTLGIDTAGTMLDDYLAFHIIKMDAKYGNGANGLGLKGYGVMKDAFSNFLLSCSKKGLEAVVFLCHTKEGGDDENNRLKPKLTGGSYDTLISKADLVGYLEMRNGVATLDFNPTTRHTGKNCAEFKIMSLPHYSKPEYKTFLGKILDETRARVNRMTQAQTDAVKLVNEYKEQITAAMDLTELEALLPNLEKLTTPVYRIPVMALYEQRFVELWTPLFLKDECKTPEDFDALSIIVKDLAPNLIVALRGPIGDFMKKQGVKWDKPTSKHILVDPPLKEAPPVGNEKPAETKDEKKDAKDKKVEPAQSSLALAPKE